MAGLLANTELLRKILVGFVRDEVRKVGVARVVLGLSGGVDSSVAAVLIHQAGSLARSTDPGMSDRTTGEVAKGKNFLHTYNCGDSRFRRRRIERCIFGTLFYTPLFLENKLLQGSFIIFEST